MSLYLLEKSIDPHRYRTKPLLVQEGKQSETVIGHLGKLGSSWLYFFNS